MCSPTRAAWDEVPVPTRKSRSQDAARAANRPASASFRPATRTNASGCPWTASYMWYGWRVRFSVMAASRRTGSWNRLLGRANQLDEVPVHPIVRGQLRVKGRDEETARARKHRASLMGRQDLHAPPHLIDDRRPDEDAVQRRRSEHGDLQVGLERVDLPAIGVPGHRDIHQAQQRRLAARGPAGHQDHPGAGPVEAHAEPDPLRNRPVEAGADHQLADGGGFPARQDQPVHAVEVLGETDLHRIHPDPPEGDPVLDHVPLDRQHADFHRFDLPLSGRPPSAPPPAAFLAAPYTPRTWSSSPSGSLRMSSPRIGSPIPSETRAITSGSLKCVVASTIALARLAGSLDLKMPEPTKFPSHPSCIISAASAGVASPPAEKFTTGSRPRDRVSSTSSYGAPSSLAIVISSSSGAAWSARMPSITARMWRTASTTFPVPASPFVRIIAAPSPIRRSASPRSRQPHTNGILNTCLLMWYRSSAGVRTSLSSMKSTPSASSTRASTKWPIRALAITGIVTTSMISLTLRGSAIPATPPSARISAGPRLRAIPAQAPASSAIFACSAVVTSMLPPPFSLWARPRLSITVPTSAQGTPPVVRIFSTPNPVQTQLRGDPLKGRDDGGDVLLERHAHLLRAFDDILAADALRECLVLHLLLDGRHVDVRQPLRRPDQRHGDHEPAELVGGEQGLLHPGGEGPVRRRRAQRVRDRRGAGQADEAAGGRRRGVRQEEDEGQGIREGRPPRGYRQRRGGDGHAARGAHRRRHRGPSGDRPGAGSGRGWVLRKFEPREAYTWRTSER